MFLLQILFAFIFLKTSFSDNTINRNVVTAADLVFWPNATIPFYINPDHYDQEQSLAILQTLTLFAFKTCLKFTPVLVNPDANQHVLVFQNPQGLKTCNIKFRGHSPDEPHIIPLAYSCIRSPTLEMIIMKSLGFQFEHNRWIRDLYIEVLLENVELANVELFTKDIKWRPELRNLPYDIHSVMHFSERDFTKNGHRTFIIKNPKVIQKRLTLTDTDLHKIDLIYGPECRKRDRQEKIEMCQQFPGVARRKRAVDPDVKINEVQTVKKDIDKEEEIRALIDQSYRIASKILSEKRMQYCNKSLSISSGKFDVFKILDQMSDYTESIMKDVEKPNFCTHSDSVLNYNAAFQMEGIPPIKMLRSIDFNTSDMVLPAENQDRTKRDLNETEIIIGVDVNATDARRGSRVSTSMIGLEEEIIKHKKDESSESSGGESEKKDTKPIDKQTSADKNDLYNTGNEENVGKVKQASRSGVTNIKKKVKLSKETKEFYASRKWNDHVVRYYIMDDGLHDVEGLEARLNEINDILKKRTCVRLEAIKESDLERFEDFLVLQSNASDFVTGRTGGKQIFGALELFEDTAHRQLTAMFVMAMLGFYFEVSRHDRDEYVKVNNRFIRPDKLHHFEKNPPEATIDLPYDYDGATHPSWQFWQKPEESSACIATFKAKDPGGAIMHAMGQHEDLFSDIDIAKINSVYGTRCFKNNMKRSKKSKNKKRKRAAQANIDKNNL